MIGQTISHYKILEKLGEGGMGVVYKARDTKLDRDVALKFLPHDLTTSDEERVRFIHEAKSVSALDHPNICTIYEVDETATGELFIAMGYYEGLSLNRRIQKGRLDVEEAVGIAIQIAEGLQAAHGQGIVHRDIKSGNIIMTDSGQVKILDFGLAHKSGMSRLTRTGTTVGTAAYMSPEQAKGEKVDARSDLWSLGVVLYEMVTGKLPFRGEHEAAILYSVVNEQLQPVEATVANASPELIHIIGRALEKEAGERYQSAGDMLIDLRRLKKETSRTGHQPVSGRRQRAPVRNLLFAVVGIAIILVAGYFILLHKRTVETNPDMVSRPLPFPFSEFYYPALSGDGNWIATVAKDHAGALGLYLMHSSGGEPRLVTALPPNLVDGYTAVSPDGSLLLIGFFNVQNKEYEEYVVPANGGALRKILQGANGRFRPDGRRVGYIRGGGFGKTLSGKLEFWSAGIDGSDSTREFIDSVHIPGGFFCAAYSPDGNKVAWVRTYPGDYSEIVIHDLGTASEVTITSEKKHINEIAWVREDQIIYTCDKGGTVNLWMVSAQGGTPVQITRETIPIVGLNCSADGEKVLYWQARDVSDFWVINIAQDQARQITFREDNQNWPASSPDGKEIAFVAGGTGYGLPIQPQFASSHLYLMGRNGDNRRQLSFGDEVVYAPVWSPDGRRIAYGARKFSEPSDSIRTYVIDPSNPGSLKYVAHGIPQGWVDTSRIMVEVHGATYLTSMGNAELTALYDDSTSAFAIEGGKYIIYQDHHRGKDVGVWIVKGNVSREEQRKTARLLPWHSRTIWLSGDGKSLFSLRGRGEVWKMVLPGGREERLHANFFGVGWIFDLSPNWDGSEVILIKRRYSASMVMIEKLFK